MLINWFPEDLIPLPGRLGLTHLPGARGKRDTDLDALQSAGVNRLLCLVESHELEYLTPSETVHQRREALERRGITFMHHPIVDFNAPQLPEAQRTITKLDQALTQGDQVIVHCWAGLGRAGTMAACLLIHRGMDTNTAIDNVRDVRDGAIQSEVQEPFIATFAEASRD